MNDLGTVAAIVGAVSGLIALYFSRRDKRFDEIGRRIDQVDKRADEVKDDMRCMESRIDKKLEAIIEELRSFRLEFRNTIHDIEADTIDLDKRLIVLETVREVNNRPTPPVIPMVARNPQRRKRRPKS